MDLLKRMREKRDIIRFVDQYMHKIEEDSLGESMMEVTHTNNVYHFKEVYTPDTLEYDICIKTLYDVCAEAKTEKDVKEVIDNFLLQYSYQQYTELKAK